MHLAFTTLFLLAATLSHLPAASLTLIENQASDYQIVISTNATPSEHYAAEELQSYLEKLGWLKLPIVAETARERGKEILVGMSARARKALPGWDEARLGPDGFMLKSAGSRLIIAGGKPRGTLNGVYTLLEERLGVRWFSPELEVVRQTNRVQLPALDETRVPVLECREVFWTEMMRDANFAARHRLNGNHYKLEAKHGGRFAVYHPFVHSFDLLIPPELYAQHPEYFPMIDGHRAKGYVQRCLSNPDVVKLSKAKVREWIKEHPEANILSVSQNDTGNWCHCPECQALDDAEGTPCASLLRFVNAIAEDIEKDFPNIRIDTLAYQYTRKPPRNLRPRSNVIIRLCSIECCFAHSLEDCTSKENQRFREDILTWQPVAPLLYIWDYTPNFAHYQQPFPNLDVLQTNVNFFVDHKVKGLFEQGNYSPGGMGELGPLRAYLLAKLLWNPRTDLARHREEFLQAWYGPAASHVSAFLDLMQQQVRHPNVHAHIFDSSRAAYLNADFVRAADLILAQAEFTAQTDLQKQHVAVTRLPLWYVQLATKQVSGTAYDRLRQRFLEVARQAGISHISESQTLEDWAKPPGQR
jgi:hypothetical protein